MKNTFFLLVGLVFIGSCIYLFLQKPAPIKYHDLMSIQIGTETFQVKIANTNEERVRGLSGTESLSPNAGMFFVFDVPGKHGIWMKDMRFPIDIAWIDSNMKIIWIERNVSPDTFPQIFYPPADSSYVLEVPAGTFDRLGVDSGSVLFPR